MHREFKKPKSKETKHFRIKNEIPQPKINYDDNPPIFSFRHMQYGGYCCLSRCDRDDKASVAKTLVELSQFPWKEIECKRRETFGYEPIPREEFKVSLPLPPFVTPEVPLKVFRHSESGRIAGYRNNDVYHILVVGDNLYNH